jgi:hypothetical protein
VALHFSSTQEMPNAPIRCWRVSALSRSRQDIRYPGLSLTDVLNLTCSIFGMAHHDAISTSTKLNHTVCEIFALAR